MHLGIAETDPWVYLTQRGTRGEMRSARHGAQIAALIWILVFTWHTLGGVAADTVFARGPERGWLLFEALPVLCVLAVAHCICRRRCLHGALTIRSAWWLAFVWSIAPPLVDYALWEPMARAVYEAAVAS